MRVYVRFAVVLAAFALAAFGIVVSGAAQSQPSAPASQATVSGADQVIIARPG